MTVLGVTPFADIPLWMLAAVATAHFCGFLIRGAFGFGSNLPIIIATTWLLGPHHAILLVIMTASMAQVHLFPQSFGQANWRLAAALTLGVYVGIGIGTYVFVSLDADALAPILGALIMTVVLMDRFDAIPRLARIIDLRAKPLVAVLSLISGFVGTVSGGGGIYFLAPFLRHMCPEPVTFRATNIALSGIFMFGRAGFVALAGLVDLTVIVEGMLLMPVVILGNIVGGRWFKSADPAGFFQALSFMLLAGAALLVARSILY
jgi:uncharacterized membrane protein YfcA